MNFNAFSKDEIARYKAEVKERWGATRAYEEYAKKSECKSAEAQQAAVEELLSLFADLGALKGLSPADEKVQEKIAALQQHITESYYTCMKEILKGLFKMYVFYKLIKDNILSAGV